ncbi:glycosyltransferase family 4 protein [Altericista sp. CCNU0014]|uniref:glycosyltransferase family 4 protein n=1 Tax=Altericista sp. CCNU0014 TaxID=3082949 RepID=UPI00384EBAB9
MNVIYDISLLGIGHNDPINKVGIYRVVEDLVYELAKMGECDLTFSATSQLDCLLQCLKYLSENPDLNNTLVGHSDTKKFVGKRIDYLNGKIYNEVGLKRFLLKVLRKSLRYSNKFFPSTIDKKILNAADIFHTPCYPIPSIIKESKKIKNFITIYDLIPILHPHYCRGTNNRDFIKSVLKSVGRDGYVACISESTKNDLCNYVKDFDPSKAFITYLAANTDIFYPCKDLEKLKSIKLKYNIPLDAKYVLSICTLEPRKNIDHVIRCFANLILEEHLTDLYLVLVGVKGWSYQSIFEEIENHSFVKKRIILTGYVADQDLAALYSGSLVFTYLSFYEGFGLPPLEAMQCGIPVITSNTSSLPEVVGNAGIMLDPLDKDSLCQNILEIYNSSLTREQMCIASIERAKKFNWRNCANQTIEAYKVSLEE